MDQLHISYYSFNIAGNVHRLVQENLAQGAAENSYVASMSKRVKISITIIVVLVIGYYLFGFLSSFVGWYGYEKWKCRVGTSDIQDSKKRGVFVKELHYQFVNFPDSIKDFVPYLEKGFKFGLHSSEETVQLKNSNYPYQLSFNFKPSERMGLQIDDDQLKKFDSCGATNGFMKHPVLNDTIIVKIIGLNQRGSCIKIWD